MADTKSFTLEGKGLKLDTEADLKPHVKPLLESDHFTSIRLNGNTLGVPASVALAEILRTQTKLQSAYLADIFTSRLLSEIPPALSSLLGALLELPNLHTVDLSDNAFGLNTAAPLVEFLGKATPLRHLILNNNGLGPEAGALVAGALSKLAQKKEEEARRTNTDVVYLETVVCGRNRLENGSMAAWAKAYADHAKDMQTVRMTQNGIRPEGITRLLRDGLGKAKGLKTLDLQDNTFTVKGATALADIVTGWKEMIELAAGDCLLGSRGAIKVANALAKGENKKLKTLKLFYNEINAEGLKQITFAAETALPALQRVELNGNKFLEEDLSVLKLQEVLEDRRETAGAEEDDEAWGLDELDELEEDEDDDEEEGSDEEEHEEEDEEDAEAERTLKDADEAENEKVSQKKDQNVDELAEQLGKTEL